MAAVLLAQASGATFGTAVAIGGHASDIALDETRGVLYIANFTANRIEVLSTAENAIRTSINVAPQPGALALSPDGQYLVVVHYPSPCSTLQSGACTPTAGSLTSINLSDKTTFTTAIDGPLGVAFTNKGTALVVTNSNFYTFDPISGVIQYVDSFGNLSAKLPVPLNTFPAQVLEAALTATPDGAFVWGIATNNAGQIIYRYDSARGQITNFKTMAAAPKLPARVSTSADGNYAFIGYARFDAQGNVLAQFPDVLSTETVTAHAWNSATNTLFAHIPDTFSRNLPANNLPIGPAGPVNTVGLPVLTIMDADNLTPRERLLLPENLTGRGVLNKAADIMYAVSDSGVVVLPVGNLNQYKRVATSTQDAIVRATICNRSVVTVDLTITDPGGGNTDFSITTNTPGVTVSPSSGITPLTVKVRVDPNSFQTQNGAVSVPLTLKSNAAVNVPPTVRLLVNNRNPEQRGTPINVSGTLTDLLADPARDRFYIVRQDRNEVLVFDGTSFKQITSLRTSTTPTRLAITFDRKYLLIGHDNAQVAFVYDLDTFEQQIPIYFPQGHYPRSIAASGNKILAVGRGAGALSLTGGISVAISSTAPPATIGITSIDNVDFLARRASQMPTLGIYQNQVSADTVLTASPNGNLVVGAMTDGTLFLYNASADTFTASRKDLTSLGGPFAASSYDQFVIGNTVFNSSLVPVANFETASGTPSGFAFVDNTTAFRVTSSGTANPGVVQRVNAAPSNLTSGTDLGVRSTRMAESPLTPAIAMPFTRTIAALTNRTSIITLTTSGFTVLAWNYDAAVAPPRIDRIVNSADQTQPVAPGGLISIFGAQLSPVNLATREIPLPTALGESCLTVNGVPVPVIFVSSSQVNGQLPFNVDGSANMLLRTPGGTSDNFYFTILPAAPRIFRTGTAGPDSGLATIYRASNNELVTLSNPIHPKDSITIYATGLGRTSPAVDSGLPAPADPLPSAVIPPTVSLGGAQLAVDYAGLVPGEVGVYQINATVPGNAPLGMDIPLIVSQAGSSTTLNVRVVK